MPDFENDITNCTNTIAEGGVILYPTDTVWGLGCDATNEAAVDGIFALKQRPKEKSLIILLADARDILQYIAAPHPDIVDIVENFETPTTVIYEGALGIAENAVHEDGSVAIRITSDPFCKALIKRMKKPLVSTSANISGEPTPATFNMVSQTIVNGAGYCVQYRRDDMDIRKPSRLVKVLDDGSIEVLRP